MIQVQTELQVADNTGAKRIECIKVLGGEMVYQAHSSNIFLRARALLSGISLYI